MNKIANIFISLIFLTSFIGIQVNKHYSNGKLYSIAVFTDAENCCTSDACDMNMGSCKMNDKKNESDCSCEDKTDLVSLDTFFVASRFSLPKITSVNILFSILFVENLKILNNISISSYYYILPPEIEKDFCTAYGVFIC